MELYAPHRPRSAAITTYATLRISSRGASSGLLAARAAAVQVADDLGDPSVYGCAAVTRACALTIRLAAMSSIARVIFFVDWTVLIRRARIRS